METKRTQKIEDYSKTVLVAYIKKHYFWSFEELEQVSKEVETQKLLERSRELSLESSKIDISKPGQFAKWKKLDEEWHKAHKKLNKLLNGVVK